VLPRVGPADGASRTGLLFNPGLMSFRPHRDFRFVVLFVSGFVAHSSKARALEAILREAAELLKCGMLGNLNGPVEGLLTMAIVCLYFGKWGKGLEEKAKRKLFRLGVACLAGFIVVFIVGQVLRRVAG
jgi:hypothetical protein